MAHIEIDTAAIAENVRTLRRLTDRDVIAVVKANAYGHGKEIAAAAAVEGGAVALATADIGEAVLIRKTGYSGPLIAWLHSSDPDFATALEHGIDVGISNEQQLARAAAVSCRTGSLGVHLKFDTGLGRNGIPEAEWRAVAERAESLQRRGLLRVTGVMSHVAGTSVEADARQAASFAEAVRKSAHLEPDCVHLTASAASLELGQLQETCGAVRIGILMYGLHPGGFDADGSLAREVGVRPALRLIGEARDGVLDVGYRHGLLPAPGAWVTVDGERVGIREQHVTHSVLERPVSGTTVVMGDPAQGEPGAGMWAERAETINYEVVTRLSGAIERREVRSA